jgi:hypothetical protein
VIWVTKADGTRQPFQREKVIRTCLRMQASTEAAEAIVGKIEGRLYNGIPTKKVLQMIFRYLKSYRPAVRQQIDLREAISMLRSKPDFERFVQLLLREHGYEVTSNQIVLGRCVEHEIDAIASLGGETFLVEVKHHYSHHTYTGLDVFREARATFEDLTEGYGLGVNSINFTKALVVCNTKSSKQASQYAKCRGIKHIGWKAPPERGLEQLIEEKRLYPITFLKGLDKGTRTKLADNKVLLLKQLIEGKISRLGKKTGIQRKRLGELRENAKEIL